LPPTKVDLALNPRADIDRRITTKLAASRKLCCTVRELNRALREHPDTPLPGRRPPKELDITKYQRTWITAIATLTD
jgi:hypothetical protein